MCLQAPIAALMLALDATYGRLCFSTHSALHRYRLERDDGNGGDCDRLAYSGPETSAAVPGLRSGAQYRFRLWAFNEVLHASYMVEREAMRIHAR